MHVRVCKVASVVTPTLCDLMEEPTKLLCPWDSPGKNIRVGCHALLQGIFPTQGWHLYLLHLLHWQGDSLPLAALGGHLLLEAAAEDLLQAPR